METAFALFMPFLFLDNPVAMLTGRESYGYFKQQGSIGLPTDPGSAGFTAEVYGCKTFGADPWSEQPLLTLERVAGPLAGDLGLPWANPLAAATALVERILGGLGDRALSIDVFANLLLGQLPQIFLKAFATSRTERAPATRPSRSLITASRALPASLSRIAMRSRLRRCKARRSPRRSVRSTGRDRSRRPHRDGHDTRAGAGAVASLSGQQPPKKVAIIGGGMGALTTAYFLTDPAAGGEFDVTVYTMGWRLGGKGASGRTRRETTGSRSMASTFGSAPTTTLSR